MSEESAQSILASRCLYLCTPDRDDLASFVERCIAGGVDVVQLREKILDAKPLLERAKVVRDVCRAFGVPFILNDRPDLALECEADGVHVGQDDAPVALARRILGPDAIIGLSTHGQDDLKGARSEPADYISTGPVVPTPTKLGRPGTGPEYIAFAAEKTRTWPARQSPMPFFVTGGVTPDTVGALIEHGATRFVVVRYLTESSDPEDAAKRLRAAIDEGTSAS